METFRALLVVMWLVACGFPRPEDLPQQVSVRAVVNGLWNGTNGITLLLVADGVNTTYTATASGAFTFPVTVPEGSTYTVSLVSTPKQHTCSITAGERGTAMSAATTMPAEIRCKGPDVDMQLSTPEPWKLDPTLEVQPALAVSVLRQVVSVTVTSAPGIASAKVAGVEVPLGVASAPQPLALGMTAIAVDVTTQGGLSNTFQITLDRGARVIKQALYGKASNSSVDSWFGFSVAISGDTLVVGSIFESSGSSGVNQDQSNQNAPTSGAAYVFRRNGSQWTQEAYIKASNPERNDQFGWAVAISGDTLAVSALNEDGNGLGGDQTNNAATDSGAVYVFQRTGTTWTQQAYLKASNAEANDGFGTTIALSGNTLAVGAPREDSDATGVNHNQANNNAILSGAVYVFQRTSAAWFQQAYIKASNSQARTIFGGSVALESDTLVVGASGESSAASGVDGDSTDTSVPGAGAVYVFHRSGAGWTQEHYIKSSNPNLGDGFADVALSGDTLAVGASGEASKATGVGGDQTDNSASQAGAVYIFVRSGTSWAQQAYLKPSNTETGDFFGRSLALEGDTLAVGSIDEDSGAVGVDGKQLDNGAADSGAVYLFHRNGASWTQQAYIKASNTDASDDFGHGLALSSNVLVIGAPGEGSIATGVDGAGNQRDNSAFSAGAIYLFQ